MRVWLPRRSGPRWLPTSVVDDPDEPNLPVEARVHPLRFAATVFCECAGLSDLLRCRRDSLTDGSTYRVVDPTDSPLRVMQLLDLHALLTAQGADHPGDDGGSFGPAHHRPTGPSWAGGAAPVPDIAAGHHQIEGDRHD